jgi:Fe-Mn family superoxide dismutase
MAFTLAPLPFENNALEPYIDTETMRIHHDLHHKAYVDNLNKAIEGTEHENKTLEELVASAGSISPAVRNNGGGHWNHTFFWESLSNNPGGAPTAKLANHIETEFGSFDTFKEKFEQAGLTRFGSGWAWLIINKETGKFQITSTPNQDNPLMDVAEVKGTPLLGIDVWEHAYYLKYQNKRADYLKNFWNVVNWDKVEDRRHKAIK